MPRAVRQAGALGVLALLGLVAGSTDGHRGRLLQLIVGPADDTPADLNVAIRVNVTNQDTAGTPGTSVTAANIPKADPNQRDSVMTGVRNYSAEPTTYETYSRWQSEFNRRGALMMAWTRDEAPQWGPSKTLGILCAPRSANAASLTITVIWEEQ